MISFIQLPYRKAGVLEDQPALRPVLTAIVLAFIVLLQIGLVVWMFIRP